MSNLHDNQQSLDSYYYQQPSAPYYNQQNQQIVIVRESQALPAIMALFFGGIGQLIQGRAAAGLLWLFNEIISSL